MFKDLVHLPRGTKLFCSICLQKNSKPSLGHISSSGKVIHPFHDECIIQWLNRCSTCPLCREYTDWRVRVLTKDMKRDFSILVAIVIMLAISAFALASTREGFYD